MDACCTCAQLVSEHPLLDAQTEKIIPHKRLDCCGRLVCARCIQVNPRFGAYCQFCQSPAPLTPASEAPPAYSDGQSSHAPPPPAPHPHHVDLAHQADEPPPYEDEGVSVDEKHPDVVHHLSPDDSMTSLSLSYKVPARILRQHNNVWSDHLLTARKIFIIPGQYYQGPSLAPDPVEDAEETERKAKIRRLMTQCKIYEYDVAVLYMEQAEWSFDLALQRYRADEQWERDHPYKGKGRAADVRTIGRRLATRV